MSTKTSKKTTSQTITKNGRTVKTETTIETSTDPSGKVTTKTTIKETIHNKDGSTSTTTRTTTNTSSNKLKTTVPAKTLRPTSKFDIDQEFDIMKKKADTNVRKIKTEKPRVLLDNDEKNNVIEFWKITNDFRQKNGKTPLKLVDSISKIAKEHNDLMLAGKRGLGHEGFHERSQRIKNSVASAENVCYCSDQPNPLNVLFVALANHPPHRVNILGDYNSIGISVAKNSRGQWFVSQLFAKIK